MNKFSYQQLFSDVFVDDPWFMTEIAQFQVDQAQNDTTQTKKMGKEKQMQMLQNVGRLLDVSLLKDKTNVYYDNLISRSENVYTF